MVTKNPKPEGYDAFKSLLGKIAQVPRSEVQREVEKSHKRADCARKKKK